MHKPGVKAKAAAAGPTVWIPVGATWYSGGGGGSCGTLQDGHLHYAELGTATRGGQSTGVGWLARALGLEGELDCGAGLWIRYKGKTTYATKADRGYGQGGNGQTSDLHYAIDLYETLARQLGFTGKGTVEISPNFTAPATHAGQPATPVQQYFNPLAKAKVTAERIDQGVDYAGTGELLAIADGDISSVSKPSSGWPGNYLEYKITTPGELQDVYIYYAEGIDPTVGYGDHVTAGQTIATLIPGWHSGIELGFAAGNGREQTYFADHDGSYGPYDSESAATRPGLAFSNLIERLGGPPGKVEGPVVGNFPEYIQSGEPSPTVTSTPEPAGSNPTGGGFTSAGQFTFPSSWYSAFVQLQRGALNGAHHSHAAWFYARGIDHLTKAKS